MILSLIDMGPEPSEIEIDAELLRTGSSDRWLAAAQWRARKRAEDPNLFLIPFAAEVPGYSTYLKSDQWKHIRKHVLKAANKCCLGCGGKATQVHHRDYRPRVMSGDDVSPLVALCKSCHDRIHQKENGKRRPSWNESERVLAELVANRPNPD